MMYYFKQDLGIMMESKEQENMDWVADDDQSLVFTWQPGQH
jgi:hypothetical protein